MPANLSRLPICLLCGICLHASTWAEPPDDAVTRQLRVQKAMASARVLLQQNATQEAVAVLEAELAQLDGNRAYLGLLHAAYTAHLKNLTMARAASEEIDQIRRRLQTIAALHPSPTDHLDGKPPPLAPAPATPGSLASNQAIPAASTATAATPRPAPQAPTTPDATPTPPAASADSSGPLATPTVTPLTGPEDPFQQVPMDELPDDSGTEGSVAPCACEQALRLFQQQRYAEASSQFAEAKRQGSLTAYAGNCWAYCRLYGLVAQLNQPHPSAQTLAALGTELAAARALIQDAPEIAQFAAELERELGQRKTPASPVRAQSEDGVWQVIRSGNFRIYHQGQPALAQEASQIAESARTKLFTEWAGPPAGEWQPPCDLYLHGNVASFTEATSQSAQLPARTQIQQQGPRILRRRIDLRLDQPDWTTTTLVHEIAHLVLADLFADLNKPLPRWAQEAMAVLALPPTQVARYLRSVGRVREQGKWIPLDQLLKRPDYPAAEAITPFYVQSVSLVDFLVRLKGAKTFALFLRETPRYGLERSIQRQYGFRSFAELEQRWLQHALGG